MTVGGVYVVMPHRTFLKKDSDTLIRDAMVLHAEVGTAGASEKIGSVARGLQ